ncbi:MAG: chloride channel protein [Deltaproteobacteria bacterium]|nr:MAG: chloride channel protein [Deltaproteobacteria bacterium]
MDRTKLSDRLGHLLAPWRLETITSGIDVQSLWRWAKLSLIVGAFAGLAAAGAFYVLEWAEAAVLYRLVGLRNPPYGAGEHLFSHESAGPVVWWLVLLVPAAGGLCAGLLSWRFAPEARGHGTDAMIEAFHFKRGRIRARVPFVKLLASLFTLGTGGSGGREGPMAQMGAGFGSYLSDLLGLGVRERRLLLLAGAAGGISALFRAPLGAALWALEVLYRDDFESDGMFPCLISSVTAYSVFTSIFGQGSLFAAPVTYEFRPEQLVFYAALGLACAPLGVLWIKLFYGTERRVFDRLPVPPWLKPALGGLAVGALALALPWVFGGGYGWMQDALRTIDDPLRQLPVGYAGFGLLLGLAVAKMLATALTISSGGSGGVFAPSLFVGGFAGGAFGLLFHEWAPGIVDQPGAFVLVGMGAVYAGVSRAPIATIILVSELFGSYDLLVPLMFAEMITVLLLRRVTLYEQQVVNRLESPAHVADFTVDVLADLRVDGHYTKGRATETIPASMDLRTFLDRCAHSPDSFFVVRGPDGRLAGVASLGAVRAVVADQDVLDVFVVGDAMTPLVSVAPGDNLRTALDRFVQTGYDRLPVIDPDRPDEVLGVLSLHQVYSAYHAELLRRRLADEREPGRPATAA